MDVKVTYKTHTEFKPSTTREPVFQLNLNAEEALLLTSFLGNLYGSGKTREVSDAIYDALMEKIGDCRREHYRSGFENYTTKANLRFFDDQGTKETLDKISAKYKG